MSVMEKNDPPTNGRLRFTWAQFVWGISILVLGLGAYFQTRADLAEVRAELRGVRTELSNLRVSDSYTRTEIDLMSGRTADLLSRVEHRLDRLDRR